LKRSYQIPVSAFEDYRLFKMLDENLPTFVIKPSSDKPKQKSTYLFSHHGSEYQPAYTLKYPDPEHHDSKNRYASALYDAYNPEVLYAEVLLVPEWTQPTLSAEQIRLNGGVPPPPEPILPTSFTIQLYNPDQQVVVTQEKGSWGHNPAWSFEMPSQSFRTPSASTLDRTQDDPLASDITPKICFKWKKDSKLSKDLACFLSGVSTNPDGSRRKNKEPDITLAIFKALREMTLYEPNLQRVDLEDMKGFEVVLLLGAAVLRDVYFGQIKETFNIGTSAATSPRPILTGPVGGSSGGAPGRPIPSAPGGAVPVRDPRIPPTDPRSQWEIDAETARLRRVAMEEERARKRAEEAEQKQIKKMLKREEDESRRKQAEIDRETERLKALYGQEDQSARPALPIRPGAQHGDPNRHSFGPGQSLYPHNQPYLQPQPQYGGPSPWGGGGYMNHPNDPYLMSGAQASQNELLRPQSQQQQRLKPKASFFSFGRRGSDERDNRLSKKRSAVF
jgi:hypothetical protein